MPLRPPQPMLFPNDLLTVARAPAADGRKWWVLHTRPRTEKKLADHCLARRIAFFLPQREHRNLIAGRVRLSLLPLFPNYLFLYGSDDCRVAALESNKIAQALPVADQLAFFHQLCGVERVVASGADLQIEEGLKPGTPVTVVTGPFAGLTGKVLRQGTKARLYVEIAMLNRGLSVEIDAAACRPVPGPATEPAPPRARGAADYAAVPILA